MEQSCELRERLKILIVFNEYSILFCSLNSSWKRRLDEYTNGFTRQYIHVNKHFNR